MSSLEQSDVSRRTVAVVDSVPEILERIIIISIWLADLIEKKKEEEEEEMMMMMKGQVEKKWETLDTKH